MSNIINIFIKQLKIQTKNKNLKKLNILKKKVNSKN